MTRAAPDPPRRSPTPPDEAESFTDTLAGELAALRQHYGWRAASIRAYAPPERLASLLAALRHEQRMAELAARQWALARRMTHALARNAQAFARRAEEFVLRKTTRPALFFRREARKSRDGPG